MPNYGNASKREVGHEGEGAGGLRERAVPRYRYARPAGLRRVE